MKIFKNATESQECIALVQWSNLNHRTRGNLIHIPNEGKRSKITGNLLKLMGLIPGCSDYFLAVPTDHYHGMFLEMKRSKKPRTKATDNQLNFIKRMRGNQYYGTVCWGAVEAVEVIEKYLNNHRFED